MPTKVQQLEVRVTELERELKALRAQLGNKQRLPWHRQVAGAFAGDPVYAEITRLGEKIRKAERRRAR